MSTLQENKINAPISPSTEVHYTEGLLHKYNGNDRCEGQVRDPNHILMKASKNVQGWQCTTFKFMTCC